MSSSVLPVILTIDDERIIRESIRSFLSDYDYEVFEAENGRVGLEVFEEKKPDLVLVDLRMPEVDGLEVLSTVKRESPNTPVIVVSGTGVLADVVEALHLGAWDYILKPIQDMSVLLHAVESCWQRASLIRENLRHQRHLEELVEQRTIELRKTNLELHEVNKQLHASEEKYRNIFNKANVGLFRFDIGEGKTIEANDVIAEMYGYKDRDDFINNFNYLGSFVKDSDRLDFLDRLSKNGEVKEYPANQTSKDDKVCWYSFTGRIYPVEGFIEGAVLDITERKHVEEERERLMLAIDQAAESIIITDPDGIIIYVNPAFEVISGYTRSEALDKSINILKSSKHVQTFFEDMWDLLRKGEIWRGQIFNMRKDGTHYEEDVTISPVIDPGGKITHYVSVRRDITEQAKLEEQLRQAQKMEAIGQLAGGVAHDFNNLLQAITGYTNMAIFSLPEGDSARDDLDEVLKASQRATILIRQLLIFSRRDDIHPVPVSIDSTVSDVMKMLRRVIGEHIELVVRSGEDIKTISADPGQIEQILMNLCVNARDAMADGGTVTIMTKNKQLDSFYCEHNAWAQPGDYVLLSVSDTGCGIPDEIQLVVTAARSVQA